MRLFGTLIVENEGDIIDELLGFLAEIDVFDAIFFFDLGSEDDTFEKAKRFDGLLHDPQVLRAVYTDRLRHDLVLRNRRHYQVGDWLAIIDADEFYAEDPRELLRFATREGAQTVWAYFVEFLLTDTDVENLEREDPTRPIKERRRHYLIDWSDARFFRYVSEGQETLRMTAPCTRRLLTRHYQFRSLEQIERRIRNRRRNQEATAGMGGREEWRHVASDDWRDYVVPSALLHCDDGGALKFGLPVELDEQSLPLRIGEWSRSELALDLEVQRDLEVRLQSAPPPVLEEVRITSTRAGRAFNTRPGLWTAARAQDRQGSSVEERAGRRLFARQSFLLARCANARPATRISFGGTLLDTTWGGQELVSAPIPSALIERPGEREVVLVTGEQRSNALSLTVKRRPFGR
jgi:Glycosyl transferase family 2